MIKTSLFVRILAITLAVLVVGYVILANTAPFNVSKTYISNGKEVLTLGPASRIHSINGISKQLDDLVYFTNKMAFKFDQASINVTFKRPSSAQVLMLGYKDQQGYHYNSQILDEPLIDNLIWPKIGTGPYLYQKTPTYVSVNEFLNNIPKDKNIGVYDYSNDSFLHSNITIPNYKPSTTDTNISVPLRGSTTLYAYVNNESFRMNFTKRDLNWYSDPDVMKIRVFKGVDQVFDATIDDDGNATKNHQLGPTQNIMIKNPGPELPEAGVYKIVIEGGDSVLTNITTNLHKVVFEGPINPISNSLVFPLLVNKTSSTDVYTNATSLTAQTYHSSSLQTLTTGSQSFKLTKVSEDLPFKLEASTAPVKLTAPLSDVVMNGVGYFAFTPDEFFEPSPYKILPIKNAADLAQIDYMLTNYQKPVEQNGWLVARRQFELGDAIIQKGSLSWLISAPGLKDSKGSVDYKQIQMTLNKKGWFKQ